MTHETPTLQAQTRDRTGTRYARRVRQAGRLPAVIYGHKTDPMHISMDETETLTILQHGGHVITVDVDGGPTETCLVKDLQFGYLGDNVIHIDFARVNLDEEVTVHVHLHFVGNSPAAMHAGAIVSHDLTELEVRCKVGDIPEEIKVDLSGMEGTSLNAGEIPMPPDVECMTGADQPVMHIGFVHKEEAVGEEVEVEATEGEPEVISDGKTDGEEAPAKE